MSDRTLSRKPSAPKLAGRHLLQKFGVHPSDPDAAALDLSATRALCIATNHSVLDIGVATGVFASELTVPYYVIIYLAGGWGASFDLAQSEALGRGITEALAAGRVIGGICHGPLGLLQGRAPTGELIVKGRRLTAVTDKQLRELGVARTPLHPETALRQAGALFEGKAHPVKDFFANHFVEDGDLITGQNQNSGPMVARLMMQRVLAKRAAAEERVAS
jgi:putative intracellular protease/amidase